MIALPLIHSVMVLSRRGAQVDTFFPREKKKGYQGNDGDQWDSLPCMANPACKFLAMITRASAG